MNTEPITTPAGAAGGQTAVPSIEMYAPGRPAGRTEPGVFGTRQ
ncbi:hypothetical protein [Nocardia sp. NPDC003345]